MSRGARAAGSLRLAPWRVDPQLAHLTLSAGRHGPLTTLSLRCHLIEIEAVGYKGVVTSAVGPLDRVAFADAGFRVMERLHLLRLVPPKGARPWYRSSHALRRGRRRDRAAVLEVDHAAFAPLWQFDSRTLDDALASTRSARLRVAQDPTNGTIVGYAICGRSSQRGYVQRLAVHPDYQVQGLGQALLHDGIAWLTRWGAREVLVNTQRDNQRALRLYQQAGFVLQPEPLVVMRLDFPGSQTPQRSSAGALTRP